VTDGTLPKSFADLQSISGTVMCRRCDQPATHRVHVGVTVRSGGRGKSAPPIATHKGDLCESCAVDVFIRFREVVR